MDEEDLLNEIFGAKWKGYTVSYCHACDTAIIICPECKNTSCSGGGCEKCAFDFREFTQTTMHHVCDYLEPYEMEIYKKGIRLQLLMVDSLGCGEIKIDFNKLKKDGRLSINDEKMFAQELAG